MRFLNPIVSNSLTQDLCADLCHTYAWLIDSKNFYRCRMGKYCNLTPFHHVVLGCNCFRLSVHRYSPLLGSTSQVTCIALQDIFVKGPYKFCQAWHLARPQSPMTLFHAYTTEWSWIHWCWVVESLLAGLKSCNGFRYRHTSCSLKVTLWRLLWLTADFLTFLASSWGSWA